MAVRVLFITTDPLLADAVKAGLGGFDVHAHDNLMGLYNQVIRVEPDALLLDGDLPRLGLEAASKFLKAKGLSRNIPVILYTSQKRPVMFGDVPDDQDPFLLAQRCMAEDFVEKDLADFNKLRKTLRRVAPEASAFDPVESGEHTRPTAVSPEGKPLVLVVDDDVPIARMIQKILDTKYSAVAVNDGDTAIKLCKQKSFACVFCDLKMPVTSGPEVYRAIRAVDAALADRFVFVTAHQLDTAEAEFFLTLKNPVVHKPFTMREILAAAATLIPS